MCTNDKCCWMELPLAGQVWAWIVITFECFLIVCMLVSLFVLEKFDPQLNPYLHLPMSVLHVIFAIILLMGIKKRKRSFVKAYYCFIIFLILLEVASMVLLVLGTHYEVCVSISLTIVVLVLILVLLIRKLMNSMDEDS